MRAPSLVSTRLRLALPFGIALMGLSFGLSGCDGAEQADTAAQKAPTPTPDAPAPDPKVPAAETAGTTAATGSTGATGATGAAAPADAAADADKLLEGITGLNYEGLTKARKLSAAKMFQSEASACGKAHSLATSLRDDASCRDSSIIAQYIIDELRKGQNESVITVSVQDRLKELKVRKVSIEGRAVFGNERAPVTMVVFADFQCPHCAAEAPKLQEAVRAAKGKAKLVYRHFPLNGHDWGRRVSMACEAGLAQSHEGFWAIHNAAFADQGNLAQLGGDMAKVDEKLRGYAQAAGLDLNHYDDFMKFERGKAKIDADKSAGEVLDIRGTPTVYVNGREYSPFLFNGEFDQWIADAANRPRG